MSENIMNGQFDTLKNCLDVCVEQLSPLTKSIKILIM